MAPKTTLSVAIRHYLEAREGMGKSPKTLYMDKGALENRFLPFILKECRGDIQLQNVKPLHIDRFFAERAKSVKQAALNSDLNSIKGFFQWCIVNNYMRGKSPCADRKRIKPPQKAKLYVPVSKFHELLDAARCPRDRIIIAIGLYLWTRSASETARLKIKDLDLDRAEVAVAQPKTGKFDLMPICKELDNELRRWLIWYAEEMQAPLDPEWYLIPARRRSSFFREENGRLRANPELNPTRAVGTPHKFVQYALEELGYQTDRQGGHTLRRSGARAYLEELIARGEGDGALEVLREMLHHSSIEQTEVYLGWSAAKNRRDKLIKGQQMFSTQPTGGNVVPLLRRA